MSDHSIVCLQPLIMSPQRKALIALLLALVFSGSCTLAFEMEDLQAFKRCVDVPNSYVNFTHRIRSCRKCLYDRYVSYLDDYETFLENQPQVSLRPLPQNLVDMLNIYYSCDFDLGRVSYADNVDTGHGNAITIEFNIYFPRQVDFSHPLRNLDDFIWLLHELEHVRQFMQQGGVVAFLTKHLWEDGPQILVRGSFNMHNNTVLEQDAEGNAAEVLADVWPLLFDVRPRSPPPEPSVQGLPQQQHEHATARASAPLSCSVCCESFQSKCCPAPFGGSSFRVAAAASSSSRSPLSTLRTDPSPSCACTCVSSVPSATGTTADRGALLTTSS